MWSLINFGVQNTLGLSDQRGKEVLKFILIFIKYLQSLQLQLRPIFSILCLLTVCQDSSRINANAEIGHSDIFEAFPNVVFSGLEVKKGRSLAFSTELLMSVSKLSCRTKIAKATKTIVVPECGYVIAYVMAEIDKPEILLNFFINFRINFSIFNIIRKNKQIFNFCLGS